MSKPLPRGIRNNNPGNIDRNATKWQGMAEDQSTDPRFVVFKSPPWGIRALARVLITYQDKHDLDTVEEIISRWAPPHENDTASYVRQVAKAIGVTPTQRVNVHEHAVMLPLVKAIIQHENGMQPYGDRELNYGLSLAGVVPEKKPVAVSRTAIGSGIATAGTAAGAVIDQVKDADVQHAVEAVAPVATSPGALETVQQAQEAVSYTLGLWEWAGIVCAGLAIIGIGIVIYSKWDRGRKGMA